MLIRTLSKGFSADLIDPVQGPGGIALARREGGNTPLSNPCAQGTRPQPKPNNDHKPSSAAAAQRNSISVSKPSAKAGHQKKSNPTRSRKQKHSQSVIYVARFRNNKHFSSMVSRTGMCSAPPAKLCARCGTTGHGPGKRVRLLCCPTGVIRAVSTARWEYYVEKPSFPSLSKQLAERFYF